MGYLGASKMMGATGGSWSSNSEQSEAEEAGDRGGVDPESENTSEETDWSE